MKLLNLGCGSRYHKDWVNVDFHSTGQDILACNLTKGIPFDKETFDVVYHSNVIEHFSKEGAVEFLAECFRVLKPGGIIRIAYPDLEQIILHYIRLLREVKNDPALKDNYDWIMLELFDQTVRNYSGGEMFKYFVRDSIPNEEFVISRCGTEVKHLLNEGRKIYLNNTPPPPRTCRVLEKFYVL